MHLHLDVHFLPPFIEICQMFLDLTEPEKHQQLLAEATNNPQKNLKLVVITVAAALFVTVHLRLSCIISCWHTAAQHINYTSAARLTQ